MTIQANRIRGVPRRAEVRRSRRLSSTWRGTSRILLEPIVHIKTCTKCHADYPATAEFFPPNKKRPDGFQSHCRKCDRAAAAFWKITHPDRHADNNRRWNAAHLKQRAVSLKRWRAANPKANKCGHAVDYAKRIGRLVYADSCDLCGRSCKPELHHPNYNYPLEAVSLCRACHVALHLCKGKQL